MSILIVQAPYYRHITDQLGARVEAVLVEGGITWETVCVPGALEIPAAVSMAVGRYEGFIVLGCVLRGETSHYDHICAEVIGRLTQLTVDHKLALGNGLLTCENEAQALHRASGDGQDKGGWAARACLEMMALRQRFGYG